MPETATPSDEPLSSQAVSGDARQGGGGEVGPHGARRAFDRICGPLRQAIGRIGATGKAVALKAALDRHRRVVIPAVLGLVGIAAAGLLAVAGTGGGGGPTVVVDLERSVLREFPEVITDLRSVRGRPQYVKLVFVVDVGEAGAKRLQKTETMILNDLQTRLREYERADLTGEAGSKRLREDLIAIVNKAVAPSRVNDILFKQLLLN